MAKLLLENGADPNKRYFLGPEICLVIDDTEALEILLKFGANVDARDRTGMTALMRAARYNCGTEQILMLLGYGADVNAMTDSRNDYRTVLHYAVLSGSCSVVNLLLRQGARVDRLPPCGETDKPSPLHLAILRGDPSILRLLIEAGKRPSRRARLMGDCMCTQSILGRFRSLNPFACVHFRRGQCEPV